MVLYGPAHRVHLIVEIFAAHVPVNTCTPIASVASRAAIVDIENRVALFHQQVGKLADLIAVQGNPLENIALLRKIDFVMKSGRIAKQDGRMTEPFNYPAVAE